MHKAVIISAPSGAGKTSIVKCLLEKEQRLAFSVSATSRSKRNNETEGQDYYFMTPSEFLRQTRVDEFIEWEQVYEGVYYGTLKREVERIWKDNKVVIFDVDVKGGINLKKYFKQDALSIFIKVQDIKVLEKRLRARGTESEATLKTRIEKATSEMTYEKEFDISVINDDLELACDRVLNTVRKFLDQ